jgi:hypothetical protein
MQRNTIVIIGAFALTAGSLALSLTAERNPPPPLASAPAQSPAPAAMLQPVPACSVDKIEIISMNGGYVDNCRSRPCPSFKGAAVLANRCSIPVGVQVKIVGKDAAGQVLAVREGWPASVRNIPPGEYPFSLDTWLDFDPRVQTFSLTVTEVKVWRDR